MYPLLNIIFHPIISVILSILVLSQAVSKTPILDPLTGVFLFVTIILGAGFRPRKPYVINSYINKMFVKVFLVVDLGVGAALWWAGFSIDKFHINTNLGFLVLLLIVALMCLAMIYILYWSLPFSRKQTGFAAVDAAIARYKKPNEEVGGVWEPPLVVEGKSYMSVGYRHGNLTQLLAFDMQGKVVSDLGLMNKIASCSRLIWSVAHPQQINARTKGYTNTQKMLKLLNTGLSRFDRSASALGEEQAKQAEKIKQSLSLIREYSNLLCEMWYIEAEWGNQHGNTHLKEVHYEDVVELNSKMKAFSLMTQKVDLMLEGISAVRSILKVIQKDPAIERQSPDLKPLMELMVGFEKTAQVAKDSKEAGVKLVKYMGLSQEDKANWENRLKWVDKVDGGQA